MVDGALALAGVRIYERAARAYDGNGGGPRLERVHRTSHPPPCRIPPSSPRKRLADRPACKRILAAPPPFRLARMVGWVGMVARGGRLLEPAIGPAPCTGLPRCSAGGLHLQRGSSTERSMALSSTSRSRVLVALSAVLTVAAHTELNASRTSGADGLVAW